MTQHSAAAARIEKAPAAQDTKARAAELARAYGGKSTVEVLEQALNRDFQERVAVVSSFGAESAVLLHLVAQVKPQITVLFGDTGMHFDETQAFRYRLAERLGLTDVREMRPETDAIKQFDPQGALHKSEPDACCRIRKVLPLKKALEGYELWVSGRKRHQSTTRAAIELFEADGPDRMKLNPLYDWSPQDIAEYIDKHDLPKHPLVAAGFPSIGCAPCTTPVAPGEDPRAGRWRGHSKVECGIHFENGKLVREQKIKPHSAPFD